ncbi:hypothetical protein O3P69_016776 [Scylla paramamosain]|uniref:CDP-diacylglycerol--inositol 3-phosphatidyltransferase n=1 Tax=Scylla paramamosain TaxID=85552 RepID=A0AAW0SYM0_SCYPA
MGAVTLPKRQLPTPHHQVSYRSSTNKPDYKVLFYIPNIIGYVRLCLLLLAFCFLSSSPVWFVNLYIASIVLDAFDGFVARKLQQCSLFGAWLDVVLDNLSRGLLWTHIHPMLYIVSALEWATFCCNYATGAEWRQAFAQSKKEVPWMIAYIMANNWRNPLGVWVISGLHVFPLWLFGLQYGVFVSHLSFLPYSIQMAGLIVLGSGRLVCGITEVWCLCSHIYSILVNSSSPK